MMPDTNTLIAQLSASNTPVKQAPRPLRFLLLWQGLAIAYVLLVMLFLKPRPDLGMKLHDAMYLGEILLLVAIAATASYSAALLAAPDLHQKRQIAFAPLMPLAGFGLLMWHAWQLDTPPAPLPAHHMECLRCIFFLSIAPAAWILMQMRCQASVHPAIAGAVAVLASGSLGCLALRLAEPTDSVLHLLEWHYLPMIGFCALGLLIGNRLLRW